MEDIIYKLYGRHKVDDTVYRSSGRKNRHDEMETRLKNRRKRKKRKK